MAQSQLTVRTLGLAMAALVLACVHAARGDGRSAGISSFGSGARSGGSSSSSGGRGNVVTIHGEQWAPTPEWRTTPNTQTQSQAARVAAERARRARATNPQQQRDEPICIVRRVSVDQTQRDWAEQARQIAVKEPALAPALKLAAPTAPLARNAFSLGPAMLLGAP